MFDFQEKVIQRSFNIPVILELSYSGCGPCIFMEKTIIQAIQKYSGKMEFVSLPVEDYPELATTFDIKSNPTTIFIKNGQEIGRLRGALPLIVVEQWINDHI